MQYATESHVLMIKYHIYQAKGCDGKLTFLHCYGEKWLEPYPLTCRVYRNILSKSSLLLKGKILLTVYVRYRRWFFCKKKYDMQFSVQGVQNSVHVAC